MKIIIPMSGIGKRFLSAGYKEPKPLIKVENKTIIQHVCNLFPKEQDFIFICNKKHLQETNMKKVLKKIRPKSKIIGIDQHKLGPVFAVSKIFSLIPDNEEIIISYCDYGTKWNYKNFLDTIRNKNADGAIAAYKGFHPHMLGSDNYAFIKEKNNELIKIKEKESFTKNKMEEYASNGTYYFKKGTYIKKYFKQLMEKKNSINNEYYVSLVYNLLVKDNLKTIIYQIENMLQWGTPLDLKEYNKWSNYFKGKQKDLGKSNDFRNYVNLMLMAGKGSRFIKEGYKIPKPFIKIKKKPMFIRAMQSLPIAKENFFVCKNDHIKKYNIKKEIKKYYKNYNILSLNKATQGQASTCEIALDKIDKSYSAVIGACDSSIVYNSKKYNQLLNNKKNQIIVFTFKNSLNVLKKPNDYSYLKINKQGNVLDVSEKKKISSQPHLDNAIVGIFYFKKIQYFFDGLELIYKKNYTINKEFYIDSIIKFLAKKNYTIKAFEVDSYIGWGTPNDLKVYQYWNKFFKN